MHSHHSLLCPTPPLQAEDIAQGLVFFHRRGQPLVLRTLRSSNVLVTEDWYATLGDITASRLVPTNTARRAGAANGPVLGDPRWAAPEILQGGGAVPASDIYSLGVVLWELLTWEQPWAQERDDQAVQKVVAGQRLALPAAGDAPGEPLPFHDRYVDLVQRCWALTPVMRPSASAVAKELAVMAAAAVDGGDKAAAAVLQTKPGAPALSLSRKWRP